MCSLENFPPLPEGNEIPVCETEGRIQYCLPEYANLSIYTTVLANHPNVSLTREMLHPASSHGGVNQIFLPVTETLWKRLQNAWYENGFVEVLNIASNPPTDGGFSLMSFCAKQALSVINIISRISAKLGSQEVDPTPVLLSSDSIRYLDWHPHCIKLAVATRDDAIRIYSSHTKLVPLLKCKSQRYVSCLAWRPLSAADLAVGCEVGIYVWVVDPNSVVMRPSASSAVLLKKPNHTHISSIAWSPEGDLLATASKLDRTMYIWEVSTERAVALKRVGGGGISLVSWAPDNRKVFAATNRIVFRVWNTSYWEPDLWSLPSGQVVAACWSPCSSVLLFATTTEPIVYALTFGAVATAFNTEDRKAATRAIDATPITLPSGERVGGEVKMMTWDGKGRYLALTFQNCDLVAVFRTKISTTVHISPCCFIKGLPEENPSVISFQKNFEDGANLTIAWSSLKVQYFPFVYTDLQEPSSPSLRFLSQNVNTSSLLHTSIVESSRILSFCSP